MFEFLVVFDRHQDVLFYHDNAHSQAILSQLIADCRRALARSQTNFTSSSTTTTTAAVASSSRPDDDYQHSLSNLTERDILLQLFSPLVASYTSMHENLDNEYQVIELLRDKCYLLMQTADNCLVMAYYHGDHTVHVAYSQLTKVAGIFRHLFGPCWDYLNKVDAAARQDYQLLVHQLLQKMWLMQRWEFNVNFQAVERVHLSANIKITVTQALAKIMKRSQPSGAGNGGGRGCKMEHLILLVGTKLFCHLTSEGVNSCVLNSDTLLFLITMTAVLFYPYDKNAAAEEAEQSAAAGGGGHTSDDTTSDGMYSGFTEDEDAVPVAAGTVTDFATMTGRIQATPTKPPPTPSSRGKSGLTASSQSAPSSNAPTTYKCVRLFLASIYNVYMPFNVHFKKLADDVVFVCVEQVPLSSMAVTLVSHIQFLHHKLWSGGASPPLDMRALTRKLKQGFQNNSTALQLTVSPSHPEQQQQQEQLKRQQRNTRSSINNLDSLATRWEEKGRRFVTDPRTLLEADNAQYFSILTNILLNLSNLFCDQFLNVLINGGSTASSSTTVAQSARYLKRVLADYFLFLSVKAERNLPATSFYAAFPGLVHFVCVKSDELWAPEFDLDFLSAQQQDVIQRHMIWCHYFAQQTGAVSILMTTKRFRFTYVVLQPQEGTQMKSNGGRTVFSMGGLTTASVKQNYTTLGFFKLILVLVHLVCVPESLAVAQAEKLIQKIDLTGDDSFRSFGL